MPPTLYISGPLRLQPSGDVLCWVDAGLEIDLGHVSTLQCEQDVPRHASQYLQPMLNAWASRSQPQPVTDEVTLAQIFGEV
jgi:hypothetical protein